jgi:enamine deaminase RidA (YjgF/YER057c/UK114 family)
LQEKARCAKQCAPDAGQERSHQAGTKNNGGYGRTEAGGARHRPDRAAHPDGELRRLRAIRQFAVRLRPGLRQCGRQADRQGQVGAGVTIEQGYAAAQGCGVNLLAQVKAALGDLDKVVRVVRLGGFINSAPDFLDGPKVLNGASDLMVTAFGDKGRHARTTVGVASLPSDAAVEVDAIFEVS